MITTINRNVKFFMLSHQFVLLILVAHFRSMILVKNRIGINKNIITNQKLEECTENVEWHFVLFTYFLYMFQNERNVIIDKILNILILYWFYFNKVRSLVRNILCIDHHAYYHSTYWFWHIFVSLYSSMISQSIM